MTIDLPFMLRALLCALFGHRWLDDPDVQFSPDDGATWRPAQYCKRCYKTRDNLVFASKKERQ
jgi:hypothetical protein